MGGFAESCATFADVVFFGGGGTRCFGLVELVNPLFTSSSLVFFVASTTRNASQVGFIAKSDAQETRAK